MGAIINFKVKHFDELSSSELYAILQLRAEVFVVEQDCVYQDVDGKDKKALHLIGYKNERIIAYTRIFRGGDYFECPSFGRVVVQENERKYGYGHDLIKESIKVVKDHFGKSTIKISAQTYLKKFYNAHGFHQEGNEYLEDGIPHIAMTKQTT